MYGSSSYGSVSYGGRIEKYFSRVFGRILYVIKKKYNNLTIKTKERINISSKTLENAKMSIEFKDSNNEY